MKSGWVTKKLGEVCEIKLGKTPPRDNYAYWDRQKSSGHVWVSISDMSKLSDGLIIDSKEYITNKAVEDAGVPVVPKGTLLLSFKLTIGRTAIAGRDLFTNEAIAALPIKEEFANQIDLHFLVLYFAAFDWNLFAAKDDKMLGKTLNKKRLAAVPIVIPPFPEQKRIVAKIDAAFEKIDKLKANAEKNLANAKELFQSALDDAMCPKNGWVEKRLGEVCEGKLSYGTSSPSCAYDSQVRYIRITDIDDNGKLLEDLVSPRQYEQKHVLEEGDVVFARTGATVGKSYLYSHSDGKCVYAGYLIRARVNQAEVLPKFLFDFTKTSCYKHYIQVSQAAAAQPNVNAEKYGNLIIPLPSLREQRQIVETIENVWEISLKLQQNYARQVADCAEMRQAILREAFEGRL